MTTIRDVAERAKVSITTVSYAINDTGTISEATRKRVLQTVEDLNYHPNAFARNLRARKTQTIGVFISRFGGLFYEEILEGIHDAALKADYELIVSPESHPKRRILTSRQVDGAIVFDSKVKSDMLLRLASKGFPIIVMDRYLEADYVLPVLIDNQQGTREAFHHLYDQGARTMSFVAGAADSFDNAERMRAFLDEAEKHNVVVRCYQGDFTEASGYDVAKMIIAGNDQPDAVFCANDQMAIGFMRAMKERGLKAPEDLAVVGFDNIALARYIQPALSTVSVPRFSWGSLAAVSLIGFLEKGSLAQPGRIPVQLIQRESSIITGRAATSAQRPGSGE